MEVEIERGREKHQFVVPLIEAFIGCFLYMPWLGIEPGTLVYQEVPCQGSFHSLKECYDKNLQAPRFCHGLSCIFWVDNWERIHWFKGHLYSWETTLQGKPRVASFQGASSSNSSPHRTPQPESGGACFSRLWMDYYYVFKVAYAHGSCVLCWYNPHGSDLVPFCSAPGRCHYHPSFTY